MTDSWRWVNSSFNYSSDQFRNLTPMAVEQHRGEGEEQSLYCSRIEREINRLCHQVFAKKIPFHKQSSCILV